MNMNVQFYFILFRAFPLHSLNYTTLYTRFDSCLCLDLGNKITLVKDWKLNWKENHFSYVF